MPLLIIAEDDLDLARALQRKAEKCGWTVTLCRDGKELLETVQSTTPPGLLLIDVNMPNIDGIEAIQHLSSDNIGGGFRIRFMTGGAIVNAVAARMMAKAQDLNVGNSLYKPFSMVTFAEELEGEFKIISTVGEQDAT